MRMVAGLVVGAVLAGSACGAVIVNGDFESGNSGFTNDYSYRVVSTAPNVMQYGVTSSSFAWTQFWNTIGGDHTTGSGLFLIADVGNTTSAIWRQTVAVTPGVDYTLSGWLATWTTFPATTLSVRVDGQQIGAWGAPGNSVWTQRSSGFNAGVRTSVTIELVPSVFVQPGADVAVDDLVLVPAPGAGALIAGAVLVAGRRRR